MPTLAAVVTMPGRNAQRTLESLRPQVDCLALFCNGMTTAPAYAHGLVDLVTLDPTNTHGSAAKLHWVANWVGTYFACDDDLAYPPDYVLTMGAAIDQWDRRALVTCHGRVLTSRAVRFKDAAFTAHALREVSDGRWLNYPGGCALAFHTDLGLPPTLPDKNVEEATLAVWAQRRRVPIWLVPHTANWLEYLLPLQGNHYTIWAEECATGFKRRNAVLAPQGRGPGWVVHEPVAVAA